MADHDAIVKLTEAGSEPEAAMICGFLESRGIRATYDKGIVIALDRSPMGQGRGGRMEQAARRHP